MYDIEGESNGILILGMCCKKVLLYRVVLTFVRRIDSSNVALVVASYILRYSNYQFCRFMLSRYDHYDRKISDIQRVIDGVRA